MTIFVSFLIDLDIAMRPMSLRLAYKKRLIEGTVSLYSRLSRLGLSISEDALIHDSTGALPGRR